MARLAPDHSYLTSFGLARSAMEVLARRPSGTSMQVTQRALYLYTVLYMYESCETFQLNRTR